MRKGLSRSFLAVLLCAPAIASASATAESSLPRDHVTTITLKTSDGDQVTKEVRIAAMGRTSDALVWKPKAVGDYTVTLTIPRQADEISLENKLSCETSVLMIVPTRSGSPRSGRPSTSSTTLCDKSPLPIEPITRATSVTG